MKCSLCGKESKTQQKRCRDCESPNNLRKLEDFIHDTIHELANKQNSEIQESDLHFTLGNLNRLTGKLDEAIFCYQKALEIQNKPKYAHACGITCAAKGDYTGALKYMKLATEKVKDYADYCNDLGAAFFKNSNYDEALEQFQKAIKINPKYANAYNNLALAYRKKGMKTEAEAALQKAMDLDQSHVVAEYELGRSFFTGGMFSVSGDSMDLDAKVVGDLHMFRGQIDEALKHYELAVELHPEYPDYLYAYAAALLKASKKTEAKVALEKALAINPKYKQAKELLNKVKG